MDLRNIAMYQLGVDSQETFELFSAVRLVIAAERAADRAYPAFLRLQGSKPCV